MSLHKNQENELTVTQRQYLYTITRKGQYMSFCSENNTQNEVKILHFALRLECQIGQISDANHILLHFTPELFVIFRNDNSFGLHLSLGCFAIPHFFVFVLMDNINPLILAFYRQSLFSFECPPEINIVL